jgi:hypothetical protein
VLIKQINPLQIWVFQEYYLRFSSIDFDLDDIENKYIHLTNNAIQINSQEQSQIKDNMWSKEEFLVYLENVELGDKILMKMQEIIYLSVKSV